MFKDVFPYIALVVTAILMPVLWHFVKKHEELKKENEKLKTTAAEVTNANLLDKMNDLCEKQDTHQAENGKKFEKIEGQIEMLRQRTHTISNNLSALNLNVAQAQMLKK